MQLTGRDNYKHVGREMGLDLVNHPELAADPETAAKIALHYWDARVVGNGHQTDVTAACKDINGGHNGLQDRKDAAQAWRGKLGHKRGGEGNAQHTRTLQHNLDALGYTGVGGHKLTADGDYGLNTRHAVEAFQRDYHLKVDGIAGAHTRDTLGEAMRAKTEPQLGDKNHPGTPLYLEARKAV
ncbi:MAG: peptidoglycan-binding protein [Rhodanobacter sp.]